MAVRLVIGRAGTGKTALCVREIRAALAADPLGPPLLWITPEQGTFSAERLLLTSGQSRGAGPGAGEREGGTGSFRAQVFSLRRLALQIARAVGLLAGADGQAGKPMDEVARLLLLEELLRQERGRLTVFASVADRPGFVRKLDATLRELRQHGHSGATLRALLDQPSAALDAVLRRKLLDLAVLLEGWSKVVERPGAWDFEYLMHHAALKMGESGLVHAGTRVWVDAISALSALEIRMLAALGQYAGEVTVTLLADPDAPSLTALRATGDPAEGAGLFARTERLHRQIIDACARHGVPLGPTVALRTPRRFGHAALGRVEAELLGEAPAARADAAAGPPPVAETDALAPADRDAGVEIWECSDPETEVRVAAQAIRGLVIGGRSGDGGVALRYRQIAVIVPELDDAAAGSGYVDAIRRIFAEHAIPHFIDARRGMAHHPLVEFLRSAVAVVTSRFERDEMLLLLKTQLAGVAEADVATLENYLIEHGISRTPWDQPWEWLAPNQRAEDADARTPASARERLRQVNATRRRVWESLRGFVAEMSHEASRSEVAAPAGVGTAETSDAARFPRALRLLLRTLKVQEQTEAWIAAARRPAAGSAGTELAQIHEQVWREVDRLLTLLESLLTGRQRMLEEFAQLLGSALQQLTLGLIPPTVDQVQVSSVARSRVPEVEVVLILGAVEGQFPRVVAEDPILSDAQREAFNALAPDPIDGGSDRQLLEMPFFDYVALTRARRRLIVSRPLADRSGKALGPSRHLQRLRGLLGDALVERRFDVQSRTDIQSIASADDVLGAVTAWAWRLVVPGGAAEDAPMAAVYNWLVTQAPADLSAARARIWSCVGPRPAPVISHAVAADFFPPGAPLRMSVSQLEQFAACPLHYFAQYTLGLRPRVEFQLDPLSLGRLQHRILERVYMSLIDGAIAWPDCMPAELRGLLALEVDGAIEELHGEISRRTPGYDKLRLRLIRILGIMLEADRRRALAGVMLPRAVELYFGRSGAPQRTPAGRLISLPVLEVAGRQRRVHLSGKIDRVDEPRGDATRSAVIDYKSAARKSMDLYRVTHGISLQLPTYALVMQDLLGQRPIAAMYVPLGLRPESVDHPGAATAPQDDAFYQKMKPRGLADAAGAAALDRALAEEGRGASGWYALKFNKDGSPDKRCDLLAHEDFTLLLDFTRWMIGTLGDALAGGTIAPRPYRCGKEIPCDQCDYAALCPFDPARDAFREVLRESKAEVLAQMREELARETAA